MAEKKFLTKSEAAELLRVSLPTIDRRIKDRTILILKLGHRVLIPESSITSLLPQGANDETAL